MLGNHDRRKEEMKKKAKRECCIDSDFQEYEREQNRIYHNAGEQDIKVSQYG